LSVDATLTNKKCELMLVRRATAYLISYSGCLGLSPVRSAKIYSRCASQPEIAKNSLQTHTYFKVIDVGTPGKLVSSACYDTQQVCVYLQPFSR